MKAAILCFITLLSACKTPPRQEDPPPFINSGFNRTALELAELEKAANTGDAAACEDLYHYYALVKLDDKMAIYWLRQAVSIRPHDSRLKQNLRSFQEIHFGDAEL